MPWSGAAGSQVFSRSNGVHAGTTVWQQDSAASIGIRADYHDVHDQDESDGINACLKKDGGNSATANIPMAGFKLTGLGTPTSDADSATKSYVDGKSALNVIRANGGLEVWQRGAGGSASIAVGASSTAYTADRWYLTTGANEASAVSQQAGIATGSRYCAQVARNSGQTGTAVMTFGFPLDADEVAACAGGNILLSFTAKSGANWSPTSGTLTYTVAFGTGSIAKRGAGFTGETTPISGSVNLTTSAVRTVAVSSGTVASNVTQGEVQFTWTPTGTAGANDWFQIDDVQLQVGVSSTAGAGPFQRMKFEEELPLCQRHFYKTFLYGTAPAQNVGINTGEFQWLAAPAASPRLAYRFAIPMRATPGTVTYYNPSAANANFRDETAGSDCGGSNGILKSALGFNDSATGSTTVGNLIGVHFTADAGI